MAVMMVEVVMSEHEPGCPRLQFWDAGEYDAPCTCKDEGTDEVSDKTDYQEKCAILVQGLRDAANGKKIHTPHGDVVFISPQLLLWAADAIEDPGNNGC